MTTPTFSYSQVSALRPCRDGLKAAAGKLGGVAAWKARGFTFREMADAGIPFDDLIWLVSAAARNEPDIERRVRLWVADCAARVLPIFEREMPGDSRPRQAIEAGRGFAVVADEVRKLSTASGEMGKRIGDTVRSVTGAISETLEISQRYARDDQTLVSASSQRIGEVVQRLRCAAGGLVDTSRSITDEGQALAGEIAEVLVSLQFQDRVSQVLSHVADDMGRLESRLGSALGEVRVGVEPEALVASSWMTEMSKAYTTPEQHSLHRGEGGSAPDSAGITFF